MQLISIVACAWVCACSNVHFMNSGRCRSCNSSHKITLDKLACTRGNWECAEKYCKTKNPTNSKICSDDIDDPLDVTVTDEDMNNLLDVPDEQGDDDQGELNEGLDDEEVRRALGSDLEIDEEDMTEAMGEPQDNDVEMDGV